MIDRVRFRNFKALREVDVPLERLTVLVGPNASGKTTVLEGIHHLTRLTSLDPRDVFKGSAEVGMISSRGAEGAFELSLAGTFRGKRGSLAVTFAAIEDYPFTDTYQLVAHWADRRHAVSRELSRAAGDEDHAAADLPLGLVMREAAFLHLDRRSLAEPAHSDLRTPLLGASGSGLAAVLADMAVSRPDDFVRLQDALRAVIPGLIRLRLVRAKVARKDGEPEAPERATWGHEIVFDMQAAIDIPARATSEGTLLILGLFAALIGPERHHIVLVDHLERCVSPKGLGDFMAQLNAIIEADPKLQVVATTDSLALLNHIRPEEVRVHAVAEDGTVIIAGLADHPDFEMLKQELRPGDFLMEVGDEWVLMEEQPASRLPPGMPPLPPITRGR